MKTPLKPTLLILSAVLLAIASVAHWLWYPQGADSDYRDVYHMISSIQGYLTALVAAGVYTFQGKSNPPISKDIWIWLVCLIAPAGSVISAWFRFAFPDEIMLAVSMVFWLMTILALVKLLLSNPKRKARLAINKFKSWGGLSLISGVLGMSLVSTYSSVQIVMVKEVPALLHLGRGFLLQGFGLFLFLGAVFYFSVDSSTIKNSKNTKVNLVLENPIFGFFLISCSFLIEHWISTRLGFLLRAVCIALLLVYTAKISRLLDHRSWICSIVWMAAWLIPLGYIFPFINPNWRDAGLHIVFMAGFVIGFLALTIRMLLQDRPYLSDFDNFKVVGSFSSLLFIALIFRLSPEFFPISKPPIFMVASVGYILGVILWGCCIVSILWKSSQNTQTSNFQGGSGVNR